MRSEWFRLESCETLWRDKTLFFLRDNYRSSKARSEMSYEIFILFALNIFTTESENVPNVLIFRVGV